MDTESSGGFDEGVKKEDDVEKDLVVEDEDNGGVGVEERE